MINNYISRNQIANSNSDNSSFYKTQFPPNVFLSQKKFKDSYISINLPLKIANKESQLYKTIKSGLGKKFLEVKPASLILFENRLKKYFLSSNFLINFTGRKSINFDEKINMGSLDFYNLSSKQFKSDVTTSANNEKLLTISKNFSLKPSKDIVGQEFYKMKYQKKNARRIAKILNNKNKYKINELNLDSEYFFENEKNNKLLFNKRIKSQDITNIHIEKNNQIRIDKNFNINNISKFLKHNSFSNKNLENLINLQIYEYTEKNKPKNKNKNNNNYFLDTSNINSHREILSKIFTPKKKNDIMTKNWKTERKEFIKRRNPDISPLSNKFYANTERAEKEKPKKKENLFLLDFKKIKKLSKKYKININSNVNELDDLTKRSKNKLLKILNSNKIEKKLYANFFKYIVKKENKEELNELNELKELLFGDERKYKKNGNENNKNESENKNLNPNQVQNKLSKTIDVASIRKMMDANGGKINKKIINLEIKEIIDNCDENIRKKININKIREKFKENYETIIKMRENLKYKKSRIYAKFKKFIKK